MPIGSVAFIAAFLTLGALSGTAPYETGSATPVDGATAQVSTVTFSSVSNSSPYAVGFNDGIHSTTVSITTDGSATDTEAGDLFVAALEADPIASGMFSGVNATGTVTLTARTPGLAITLTEVTDTGGHMALATTTSASSGTQYPLGRFVQLDVSGTQVRASLPDTPTQGTIAVTVTHAASSTYRISLGLRSPFGVQTTVEIGFSAGANVTATGAAMEAAVEASTAIYGVAGLLQAAPATPSGSDVVVTITLPAGWSYIHTATTGDVTTAGAAALAFAAGTTAGAVPACAIVHDPGNLSSTTLGGSTPTYIDGGKEVPFCTRTGLGNVVVADPGSAPSFGAMVFYETAAGANRGLPLITPTATSLPTVWVWRERVTNSSDGQTFARVGAA